MLLDSAIKFEMAVTKVMQSISVFDEFMIWVSEKHNEQTKK